MSELNYMSAHQLAALIRERQASAVEVLDAHLEQIVRHNPALNAIVTLDEEGARTRARQADEALERDELWGPLHGVPITIKDAIATAGMRTTSGFPPWADFVPAEDAPVVARLRAAGAVILGKTNLPTLSGDGQTDNPIFGRSNNPWDVARTPGGSGGGGSAALAAGLTPIDIGGDIGGSVRIPAHYCGVCAIKPSEYRVPGTGYHPSPEPGLPWATRQHMGLIGPMTRSVDDLVLTLRLIAGPDGQHLEIPPAPLDPLPELPLNELRLAWTDDFGGVPVTQETRDALAGLAIRLERLGCQIERRAPQGVDWVMAWETHGELYQAGIGSTMSPEAEAEAVAAEPGDPADTPFLRGMVRAVNMTMRQYAVTLANRDALILALERFFTQWDALLCPVTASPAFPHCSMGTPLAVDDRFVPYWNGLLAYTAPFNLSGHPAAAVPLARSQAGLPIGLQIVGRRWGDMKVLAIAKQISAVIGPFQRPPGY